MPINKPSEWKYVCEVTRVIDGDTIEVRIRWDMGFNVVTETIQRIRLARINAPERFKGTEEEREAGKKSMEWLTEKIHGQTVTIKTSKAKKSFNRYIAEVCMEQQNISDQLVTMGHAKYQEY